MFKNVKKKVMPVAMVVLALGSTLSVAAKALDDGEYTAYVTKLSDYNSYDDENKKLFKTVLGDATNQVNSIPEGIDLCSWILNYLGMKVTNKKGYNSTGKYYMTFDVVPDVEHPGVHLETSLVISTQLLEFSSSTSTGKWSPDTF